MTLLRRALPALLTAQLLTLGACSHSLDTYESPQEQDGQVPSGDVGSPHPEQDATGDGEVVVGGDARVDAAGDAGVDAAGEDAPTPDALSCNCVCKGSGGKTCRTQLPLACGGIPTCI